MRNPNVTGETFSEMLLLQEKTPIFRDFFFVTQIKLLHLAERITLCSPPTIDNNYTLFFFTQIIVIIMACISKLHVEICHRSHPLREYAISALY